MKLAAMLSTVALVGCFTIWDAPIKAINPLLTQASAAEAKDATGLTPQQKIEFLAKHKGEFGSGDALRRYFFGDLEPIAVQPGGAGMVVNLYNKTNDVTIAYCSTYDVVVAIKKGKVTKFAPDEVK